MVKYKIIIVVSILLFLIGCSIKDKRNNTNTDRSYKYRIVVIDSCEYIIFWDEKPNMAVVHKANCKKHKNGE